MERDPADGGELKAVRFVLETLAIVVLAAILAAGCGPGGEDGSDFALGQSETTTASAETVTTSEDGLETPPGATVVAAFAPGVIHIPLTHTGEYIWESPVVDLDHAPDTFVTAHRVEGAADVSGFSARMIEGSDGWTVNIRFTVESVQGPATLLLLGSEARDLDDEEGP